jgi:hypothetical protein
LLIVPIDAVLRFEATSTAPSAVLITPANVATPMSIQKRLLLARVGSESRRATTKNPEEAPESRASLDANRAFGESGVVGAFSGSKLSLDLVCALGSDRLELSDLQGATRTETGRNCVRYTLRSVRRNRLASGSGVVSRSRLSGRPGVPNPP